MSPVASQFQRSLALVKDRVILKDKKVLSNLTGSFYTHDYLLEEILTLQIVHPVLWIKNIQMLYSEGVRAFVECGPAHTLSHLTREILGHDSDIEILHIEQLLSILAFSRSSSSNIKRQDLQFHGQVVKLSSI
jgi:acyl transferase domain-containing protein